MASIAPAAGSGRPSPSERRVNEQLLARLSEACRMVSELSGKSAPFARARVGPTMFVYTAVSGPLHTTERSGTRPPLPRSRAHRPAAIRRAMSLRVAGVRCR